MKRIKIVFALLAIALNINSQSWISSNVLLSDNDVNTINSAITSDGSVVVLGYFTDNIYTTDGNTIESYGGRDYFVVKFDPSGSFDWISKLGSPSNDFVTGGIGIDSNDDIFVTGSFVGNLMYSETDSLEGTGSFDIFCVKYNVTGDILWARNIGKGSNLQTSNGLSITNNGEVLLAGQFRDSIEIDNGFTLYSSNTAKQSFYGVINPTDGSASWVKQIKSISSISYCAIWGIESGPDWLAFTGMFKDSIQIDNDTIAAENQSQDVTIFKTDLLGNLIWQRRIGGDDFEYCYNIKGDEEDNLFFGGYYKSSQLLIDSNSDQTDTININLGSYDIILGKYSGNGDLEWKKTAGGKEEDRVNRSDFFDGSFYLSGSFHDTLHWGGIQLNTNGPSDQDMFTGSVDIDGNFRSANSYSGDKDIDNNDSKEEGRSVFQNSTNLYSILRSNSKILQLGEDIYSTSGESFSVYLGIIGCKPISIDNTIYTDVPTCYGDSTGSILISASGGFEGPWQYSIDNGLNYQTASLYGDLPAGEYQIVVIDKENCSQTGDLISLTQPDTIIIEVISTSDITADADGSIVVGAQGGTSPYTYTLQPGDVIQGFGTFMFGVGDSGRYVIQVNDQNLCGPVSTDTIEILDMSHVGINDIGGIALRVFPNPATDIVNIEMPLEASAVTMEVLSLTGQIVMSRQAYTTGGVLRETLDVSDLAQGMYMLRVNGQTLKSAIVVQ